jgi:AmmeMemoRadiSam system protein B
MLKKESHRQPITTGLFYPSERKKLQEKVIAFLTGKKGAAPALILPHTSYEIMGPACGRVWSRAADRVVDRILLMGPVHREPEKGFIFPQSDFFSSPLGDIPLDRESIEILVKSSDYMKIDQTPHEEEHCLELSLPFISTLFPHAKIIPCLAGDHKKKDLLSMAKVLSATLEEKKDTLLTIITTNLSSFDQEIKTEKEAEEFWNWLKDPSQERKGLKACGAHLISLYNMTGLQRGIFQPMEQFKTARKESKTYKTVFYGTCYQL